MKEHIELKYELLFCMLDLDFEGYKALIALRDEEINKLTDK